MPFDGLQINPTAAHLIRAKQYLIDRGWCPEAPSNDTGSVCIAIAIGKTALQLHHGAGYLMGQVIGVEPSYIDGHSIGVWQRGKTIDDVIAAFDKAIGEAMRLPA